MEFKYNIPEQLEVNSKLVIRSEELEVLHRTHKEKKFYYINGGRELLIKTNLITRESPYIHRTENTQGCKEDEFNLAHKFSQSDLPVWLINDNPIVADSLDNLMKYINYITEVSKSIPESKEEKRTRKRNKLRRELNMGMGMKMNGMNMGMDPMMGMLSIMEKITKLERKTKKLKKEISILKNK